MVVTTLTSDQQATVAALKATVASTHAAFVAANAALISELNTLSGATGLQRSYLSDNGVEVVAL